MDGSVRTSTDAGSLWLLEQLKPDRFRGWCRDGAPERAFGGQVAAQALAAGGADLSDDWYVGSLHAYFVREGRSSDPIEYQVDPPDDDTGPVRTRQITAIQADKPILTLEASFRLGGDPVPVNSGHDLPIGYTPREDDPEWLTQQAHRTRFELRFDSPPTSLAARRGEVLPGQEFWLRTATGLPDERLQHACGLTYASDMFLVSTAIATHGVPGGRNAVQAASLDHTVWFHHPVRADDWVRYEQFSQTAAGDRSLAGGRMLDQTGRLVATIRQEVLIRYR